MPMVSPPRSKALQLLESGQRVAAEGMVFEAYMTRGLALEAARFSLEDAAVCEHGLCQRCSAGEGSRSALRPATDAVM